MSTVDNRIVEMRFDNKQFEEGIRSSVKSLNDLKTGLDLKESTKSLERLGQTGKNFSLSGIADGVNSLTSRFTNMGIVGITAIQNITNSAIESGKRIASAFTLDPITQGFEEYEIKMNAIQTIMTNTAEKGTSLGDVNKALTELNTYADATIYNFAQMTDNVGKFTAAGVGLTDSVSAIKGLSNLAAGFGVDATKMAAATYQMSQAVAAGSVKLIDWNSLVQAGMGGQKTQDALKNTAKSMGVFVDESKPFRETLEQGWLSSEVFLKTMEKMAKDPSLLAAATNVTTFTKMVDTMKEAVASGWASTWELLIGDKNQSTALFTGINNAFSAFVGGITNARNEVLKFWTDFGGRKDLLIGIGNVLIIIGNLIAPIENAMSKLIPSITGERLVFLTKKFREFTDFLLNGQMKFSSLGTIFAAFGSTFTTMGNIIGYVSTKIWELLQFLAPVGKYFVDGMAKIAGFNIELQRVLNTFGLFNIETYKAIGQLLLNTFNSGVTKSIEYVSQAFVRLGKALEASGITSTIIKNRFEAIGLAIASLGDKFEVIKTKIKGFINAFKGVENPLSAYTVSAAGANNATGDVIQSTSLLEKVVATLKGVFNGLLNVCLTAQSIMKKLVDSIRNEVVYGIESITFDKVINAIETFLKFGLLLALRDIGKAFRGLPKLVQGATETLDVLRSSLETWQTSVKSKIILNIAIAVGVLAASILAISMIDTTKVATAATAIGLLFAEVAWATKILASTLNPASFIGLYQLSLLIIGLSASVYILSGAMVKLKDLSWTTLIKGLITTTGLLFVLAKVMPLLSRSSVGLISASLGLIGIAYAIKILAGALVLLTAIPWQDLLKATLSLGVILVGLTALTFAITSGIGETLLSASVGITLIAGAMLLFAGAIGIFAAMNINTLIQGLTVMAVLLAGIVVSFRLLPVALAILEAGGAIALLAVAMNLLIVPVFALGNMNMAKLAQGIISIGVLLASLVVAGTFLTGTIAGAGAIAIMAASLNLLIIPIAALGNLSLAVLATGIIAMAVALGVLGGLSYLLAPLSPVMLGISTGIALVGLGMVGVAGGISLLASALVFLAASAASVYLGIPLLGKAMRAMVEEINKTIPMLEDTIDLLLIALINSLPRFEVFLNDLFAMILRIIVDWAPKIVVAAADILIALADEFEKHDPEFQKSMDYLEKLLLRLLGDLVVNIIKEIPTILWDLNTAFNDSLTNMYHGWGVSIREAFTGEKPGEKIATDIVDGMDKKQTAMVKGASDLGDKVNEGLQKSIGKGADSPAGKTGGDFVGGIIEGINNKSGDLDTAARQTGAQLIKSINDSLGIHSPAKELEPTGENAVGGIKEGVKKAWGGLSGFFKDAGNALIKAANDPLKKVTDGMTESSKKSSDALNKQIGAGTKSSTKAVGAMGEKIKTAYEKAMEWVDDQKYYGKLTLSDELNKYNEMVKTYSLSADERKKLDRDVFRVKQEITKQTQDLEAKAFQKSKDWIADRKYYNELSLEEELAAWERVSKSHTSTDEMRKESAKEVYRVKKELLDKEVADAQVSFDKSQAWISERMAYDDLNMEQQLAAAIRVEATAKANSIAIGKETQAYKDARLNRYKIEKATKDKENELTKQAVDIKEQSLKDMLSLEKDYAEKAKQINKQLQDDEKELTTKYLDAVNTRTAAIVDSYGIFDKLDAEITRNKELLDLKVKMTDVEETLTKNAKVATKESLRDVTSEKESLLANIEVKRNELLAIQQVQKQNRQGTTVREDANAQAREKGLEFSNMTTKLEELNSMQQKYDENTKTRIDAEKELQKIKDDIKSKDPVTGAELIDNLKGQVTELKTWRENIASLESKGLDKELLGELRNLGPKVLPELKALNNLTGDQLNEYAGLWVEKYALARTQALDELEGMRLDNKKKVEALALDSRAAMDTLNSETKTSLQNLNTETQTQLGTLSTTWKTEIGTITSTTGKAFTDLVLDIKKTLTTADFYKVGEATASGFTGGVANKTKPAQKAIWDFGATMLTELSNSLQVRSPSKKTFEIGQFAGQGFINGLSSLAGLVSTESAVVGGIAMDILQNAASKIADFFSGSTLSSPTITPVLDLSNIQNGASQLSGMLGTSSINLARNSGNVTSSQSALNSIIPAIEGQQSGIVNTFEIANMNIREEADIKRVARELYQLQVATSRG